MGRRGKIVAAVGLVAAAAGWLLLGRGERFEIVIVREGATYATLDDCRKGKEPGSETMQIPMGTHLSVTAVDWGGKHWPCFKSEHQGKVIFLTSDRFQKR